MCGRSWDHPRVGGEKVYQVSPLGVIQGSPPRRRGKACGPGLLDVVGGITPAWAGKSRPQTAPHTTGRDHPRVGGEKTDKATKSLFASGSPPRGRGKVRAGVRPTAAAGITPAWAGKSLHFSHFLGGGKDHPRVGGEKPLVFSRFYYLMGSPPRGRGKAARGRLCV